MVSIEKSSSTLATSKWGKLEELQQLYSNLVFCLDPFSNSSLIAFNKTLGLAIFAHVTSDMVELRSVFGQNLFTELPDILEALDQDRLRMCEGFVEDEMVDVRQVYVEPADELRARCRSRNCCYVMSKDENELVCSQCRLVLGLEDFNDYNNENGFKKEYDVDDDFKHFLDAGQNDRNHGFETIVNQDEMNEVDCVIYSDDNEERPIIGKRDSNKVDYCESSDDNESSDEEMSIISKRGRKKVKYKEDNNYKEDNGDKYEEKPTVDADYNIKDDFDQENDYNGNSSDSSDMYEEVKINSNIASRLNEKDGVTSVKERKISQKETSKSLTQCPKCLNSYRRISTVEKHIREGCPVNRNVSYQDTILNNKKDPDEIAASAVFKCNLCLRNFPSKKSLAVHLVNHRRKLGNLSAPVKCPICGETLKSSKLNKHIHQKHDPNQGCCLQCLSVMPNEDLGEHMSNAHIERPHLCSICGTSFVNKSLLALHISTKHDSSKTRVMCDICGKVFAHRVRLQQHVSFFHTLGRCECKFCGKSFPSLHAMYKHKKMHSKNKPFHCSICDYSSVVRANVTAHVKKVHKVDVVLDQHIVKIGRFEFDE